MPTAPDRDAAFPKWDGLPEPTSATENDYNGRPREGLS